MGVLANARRRGQALSGRWVMVPRDVTAPRSRRRRVVRRRRTTFERLVAAAGATFVLGLVPQLRWLLLVHLAIDAVLGGYAARLIQWKQDEARRTPAAHPYPVEDAYSEHAVGQ